MNARYINLLMFLVPLVVVACNEVTSSNSFTGGPSWNASGWNELMGRKRNIVRDSLQTAAQEKHNALNREYIGGRLRNIHALARGSARVLVTAMEVALDRPISSGGVEDYLSRVEEKWVNASERWWAGSSTQKPTIELFSQNGAECIRMEMSIPNSDVPMRQTILLACDTNTSRVYVFAVLCQIPGESGDVQIIREFWESIRFPSANMD